MNLRPRGQTDPNKAFQLRLMARGRGGKAKRGGGRSFSRDLVVGGDGVAFSNERRGYELFITSTRS